MKHHKLTLLLVNGLFIIIGAGFIISAFLVAPDAKTDDGYPLDTFFFGMGVFFILFPTLVSGLVLYIYHRGAARISYLKTQGIPGKARVLSFTYTGVTINNVPQAALELNISSSFGEQYTTGHKRCIMPVYYQYLTPDKDIPVYIDPKNRKNIYLDFEQMWQDMARQSAPGGFAG